MYGVNTDTYEDAELNEAENNLLYPEETEIEKARTNLITYNRMLDLISQIQRSALWAANPNAMTVLNHNIVQLELTVFAMMKSEEAEYTKLKENMNG